MSKRVVMGTASTPATASVPAAQVEAYKARGWRVVVAKEEPAEPVAKSAKGKSDK